MERLHWQDGVTLLAGVVLAVALLIMNITPPEGVNLTAATWNFEIVGVATIGIAIAALLAYNIWEEWVLMALGVWMAASPWILNFSEILTLTWIALVCGAVIAVMGLLVLMQPRKNRRS